MQSLEPAKSIVLIGMPGAGKSTLGRALAQIHHKHFVDTDILLESVAQQPLQAQLDQLGFVKMREFEGQVVAQHEYPNNCVVATGDSVVYSTPAMEKLSAVGPIIYLQISLEEVRRRVHNWHIRGFSAAPGQSLEDVFTEREKLYRHFSNHRVDCSALTIEQSLAQIETLVTWT